MALDEVIHTTTRRDVAAEIETMLKIDRKRGNRYVVSSRFVGYREARLPVAMVRHVSVAPLSQDEINRFAEQWCLAWARAGSNTPLTEARRAEALQDRDLLLRDLDDAPMARELGQTPLLLTMLALLRREGSLPTRRIDLYQEFTRLLLRAWPQNRTPNLPAGLDVHVAEVVLTRLAMWLTLEGVAGTAPKEPVKRQIARTLLIINSEIEESQEVEDARLSARSRALHDAEAQLDALRGQVGLLVERGRDAWAFLHQSFREYFTARALAELSPDARWNLLEQQLHDPVWLEPMRLCVAHISRQEASALVRRILAANSAHEAILHRDLLLATDLAAQDISPPPSLVSDLVSRLDTVAGGQHAHATRAALTRMAGLAAVGLESAAERLCARATLPSTTEASDRPSPNTHYVALDALATVVTVPRAVRLRVWLVETCQPPWSGPFHQPMNVLVPAAGRSPELAKELRTIWSNSDAIARKIEYDPQNTHQAVWYFSAHRLRPPVHPGSCDDLMAIGLALRHVSKRAAAHLLTGVAARRPGVIPPLLELMGATDCDQEIIEIAGTLVAEPAIHEHLLALAATGATARRAAALRQLALSSCATERMVTVATAAIEAHLPGAVRAAGVSLCGRVCPEQLSVASLHGEADKDVREALLRHLASARIPRGQSFAAIRMGLTDAANTVRATAAGLAGDRLESSRLLRTIMLTCAKQGTREVAQPAMSALATLSRSNSHLRARLTGILSKTTTPDIQPALIRTIAPLLPHDRETRRAVQHLLGDPRPEVRAAALKAIGPQRNARWIARLDELTRDPAEHVAGLAATLLIKADAIDGHEAAITAVAERLSDAQIPGLLLALVQRANHDDDARAMVRELLHHERLGAPIASKLLENSSRPHETNERLAEVVQNHPNRELLLAYAPRGVLTLGAQLGIDLETHRFYLDAPGLWDVLDQFPHERLRARRLLQELDPDRTLAAATLLARTDQADEIVLLEHALEKADPLLKCDLVRALAGPPLLHKAWMTTINSMLESPLQPLRFAALMALAKHQDVAAHQATFERFLPDAEFEYQADPLDGAAGLFAAALYGLARAHRHTGDSRLVEYHEWLAVSTYHYPCLFFGNLQRPIRAKLAAPTLRRALAVAIAPHVANDPKLREHLVSQLDAPTWQARQGATWTLVAAGPDPALLPVLRRQLHDRRGDESWLNRLHAAGTMLDSPDSRLAAIARGLVQEAAGLHPKPWQHSRFFADLRRQAIELLSRATPTWRDDKALALLLDVCENDVDPQVRSAAWLGALTQANTPPAP